MSDQQTVSGAEMTPDEFIARAVDHELTYARQSIKDMHVEVKRLKSAAERIIKTCDWLLTGDTSYIDEEPF